MKRAPGVLVHGGAGDVPPGSLEAHLRGVRRAALAGAAVLRAGGSALDAAQRAVEVLEDDPNFNAGTGGCLTEDGRLEFDAALMDGSSLAAGGVCALEPFRHPIAVARAVLAQGRHHLYAGEGAGRFARAAGFRPADPEAMVSSAARERLRLVRERGGNTGWAGGTVGAVAWDGAHLAAATSTGGTVNKAAGRVGDSPILGAGTLADDQLGAASCTGQGEAILRVSLARIACEWMGEGTAPADAVKRGLERLRSRGRGDGGLIVLGPDGTPAWGTLTRTMTHAYASVAGELDVGA